MTFELRPSTHEAFAERLRSAEARRQQELSNKHHPRSAPNMAVVKKRWDLEEKLELQRIEREHKEV